MSDFTPSAQFTLNDIRRFFDKVDIGAPNECWEWLAVKIWNGYGRFTWRGKKWLAHRLSWMIFYGTIPDELCVLHHCDNRGCVNPEHLFLGTKMDNARDRDIKGRRVPPVGEKNGFSKLTWPQVREIRMRYAAGGVTQRELGRYYGVAHIQIRRIVRGENWQE